MQSTDRADGILGSRRVALAGILAPILFIVVTVVLWMVQHDFLVHNNADPTINVYPSANSRGAYGWLQIANFIVTGLLVIAFAAGLYRAIRGGLAVRLGIGLLLVAGVALVVLGPFTIDPPISASGQAEGRTFHGTVHLLAYVVLALSTFAAYLILSWPLRGRPLWRSYGWYSLVTAIGMAASFIVSSVLGETHAGAIANYLFFLMMLGWLEVIGLRLWIVRSREAMVTHA